MPADFFALMREDDDVRRLLLHYDVQEELSAHFEAAASRLRSSELDLIPLGNDAFRPDMGEAWIVDPFSFADHTMLAFENPIGCPTLAARDAQLPAIKALVARFSARRAPMWLAFQTIERRQLISPRGLSIIMDAETFRKLEEPGLHIGQDVHAIWTAERLVFDQTYWARRIFDIADYYREATDRDLQQFVERPEIIVSDPESFRGNADQWIRKRVALIMDSGVLEEGPRKIRDRAVDHDISIELRRVDGRERIVLPESKRELKDVLKFLDEDIYKGPLTDSTYESNSKRRRQA